MWDIEETLSLEEDTNEDDEDDILEVDHLNSDTETQFFHGLMSSKAEYFNFVTVNRQQ